MGKFVPAVTRGAFAVCCALGVAALNGSTRSALAQAAPERMELRKLADDVYMMQNPSGSSNSAFIVTDEGVVVFDADIRTGDQVFQAIRRTTDKKIKYFIASHPSGDHATGAWHFREDKPLYIGTRKLLRDLYMQEGKEFAERKASNEARYAAYKNAELLIPDIAFDGAMTLRFGGLTFQITEEGSAHSNADTTLYIPQKRVFFTGDLLDTEIHPGQGESAGVFYSNTKRWIQLLDQIMDRHLPVDTYMPGHGPAHIGRGVADLEEQKRYFIVVRDAVSKMIAQGKTLEEIQADFKVPEEFAHYHSPTRLKSFLVLFYHQLIEQGYWP